MTADERVVEQAVAPVGEHRGEHGSAIHLPGPTLWPFVCGAGVALIAFGLLTHLVFSLVGLMLLARALAGWIEELRHE
jgi:hypothetical protein